MIYNHNQFINWVLTERGGKSTKVPVHPRTLLPIDPTLPSNWGSYQDALATGKPVGFVFTDNDPYFFLDLDHCRGEDGQWSADALEICKLFAGCAIEMSQSGNGIHIVGTCDKSLMTNKKHKWDGWLEFYTSKRFMALGKGFEGDFSKDMTATLMSFVPEKSGLGVGDVVVGEGCGHALSAEDTISKMLASRGGTASKFGDKPTVADLFEGNVEKLTKAYPSYVGDGFDRSSADMALMTHLAFWTAKDPVKMDEIFRRSALMRDKYAARADYRNETIRAACGRTLNVYEPTERVVEAAVSAAFGEYLTTSDQIEYFKGCVYIRDKHEVFIPSGDMLNPSQFKSFYGGYDFQMAADNTRPSRNAFEAFTENRNHKFPKVAGVCFKPNLPPLSIIEDKLNIYIQQPSIRRQGDAGPFLDLVGKLLPDVTDQQILLSYCAAMVQNVGKKFQYAVVLQGTEGNGKTIISKCLEYAIGEKYTHCPLAEDLGNKFNDYIENKLLITVEEVHLQGKRELLDALKPLITNNRVEVQPKGGKKRMVDNFTNWFLCTNHKDAIIKTKSGRRYAIFFTAQQSIDDIVSCGMDGDYFPKLWNWLRDGGFEIVNDYLHTYKIVEKFNPAGGCHRSPRTSTEDQVITASYNVAEQVILEAISDEETGFRGGWISS